MKRKSLLIIAGLLSLVCLGASSVNNKVDIYHDINAKSLIMPRRALAFEGTYHVPLKTDLKMKDEVFNHTVIIEKTTDNVYMTFTQDDSRDMTNMTLLLPGKIGTMVFEEGIKKSYVYTLSEEQLANPFPFSVFIPIMSKTVTFNMTLLMDEATYIGDSIQDLGERPARYLPDILGNFSDAEMEKGSTYFLPDTKAYLLDKEIEVNKKVTHISGKDEIPVEVIDNKLLLSELGTYKITYSAESDLYKTSLGNNSKSEISFNITSKVGASSLAKYKDINNCVDDKAQLQANIVTFGKEFDAIANKMKNIADNYQVFNIEMFLENGDKAILTDKIEVYLKADQFFDRNKVKIAQLDDDGNLINYEVKNYGRYIAFQSLNMGNYIVYVEGVAFIMPIWGYVLIGAGALIVITSVIASIIIIKRKQKKNNVVKK